MPTRPYFWIDAFTQNLLGGNACAVVLDADDLSVDKMQALAREMNLSETAFVMASEKADFRARYFTPDREIPLAGHPTIAVLRSLMEAGRISAVRTNKVFRLELEAGVVEVEVLPQEQDFLFSMKQLAPSFWEVVDRARVGEILGLRDSAFHPDLPPQVVNTGTPFLMVPVANAESLEGVRIRQQADFNRFSREHNFFGMHIFALDGNGGTVARHPGLPPDGLEDPFTGSATGCMGAYLWHRGAITAPSFVARQGSHMGRPGEAVVTLYGEAVKPTGIGVAGYARTLVKGEIRI